MQWLILHRGKGHFIFSRLLIIMLLVWLYICNYVFGGSGWYNLIYTVKLVDFDSYLLRILHQYQPCIITVIWYCFLKGPCVTIKFQRIYTFQIYYFLVVHFPKYSIILNIDHHITNNLLIQCTETWGLVIWRQQETNWILFFCPLAPKQVDSNKIHWLSLRYLYLYFWLSNYKHILHIHVLHFFIISHRWSEIFFRLFSVIAWLADL